jgi:hypothetical protein
LRPPPPASSFHCCSTADIDPAIASGTFVTTVTDVVGFFAFLGIATLWLNLAEVRAYPILVT